MKTEEKAKQEELKQNKDAAVQPDPETLHTTDPQEHMEGPISSLVQGVKENVEEKGGETADDKK
jgi:hypothetical protein